MNEEDSTTRLQFLDWGLLPYAEAMKLQEALVSERIAGISTDRLVVVEHPPVITIGRSGSLKDLRESEGALGSRGVSLFHADRGGMTTFHGPGQLVAYPIVKLKVKDLHLYLRMLLDTVSALLCSYGLVPELRSGRPGVWTGSAKIASVGIAVRSWVAYHGVALNVNTDLRWFEAITPCGNPEEKITSMERELGRPLELGEVKDRFAEIFCRVFGYSLPSKSNRGANERPPWLVLPAPKREDMERMGTVLSSHRLGTVCEDADCPNIGECFGRGTATFMILGGACTRRCRFCSVGKSNPDPVDKDEPERVAMAVEHLGLKHAVITSVTRDDLPDGGAGHFVRTLKMIRKRCPGVSVEFLVPDFGGSPAALREVCGSGPEVFGHNLETVSRLYALVRPGAVYKRSLQILQYAAGRGLVAKSGLMLGLGETECEVLEAIADLRRAGCSSLTLGQYLPPSAEHFPVARYLSPQEFEQWAQIARSEGFTSVAAGPLVRSSYHADEMILKPGT